MPTVLVTPQSIIRQNSPFSLTVAVTTASTHFAYPRRDDQAELACTGGVAKVKDGIPENGQPSRYRLEVE